jgi:FtsP/CotA-like multicopper oxidase with cupredoxin domain
MVAKHKITRRQAIYWGAALSGGLLLPLTYTGRRNEYKLWAKDSEKDGSFFGYTPFTQPLFIPPVLTALSVPLSPIPQTIFNRGPIAPTGNPDDVAHGIAPEFGECGDWNRFSSTRTHEQEFRLFVEETTQRFVPGGPDTPIFTYRDGAAAQGSGRTPGPTIVVDYRGPVVLRNFNLLTRDRSPVNTTDHDHETSIHLHGTHGPAHSDGYPDFYTLAGEGRDYFYTNISPRETLPVGRFGQAPVCEGPFDETWIPSTLWYHDHAMDLTGFNVSRGLAGFYLVRSQREALLADIRRIPRLLDTDVFDGPLDFGLALTDQLFNDDGTIFYDFLDHNGRLGNVFTVNGLVQPFHKVERRKYRVRFLNASNARHYEIRLSNRQKMFIIGTDSWLLPEAVEVESFRLAPAQRHDVIIDFRGAPDEVIVENILHQTDGRKAREVDPDKQRDPLLKFVVSGAGTDEPIIRDRDVIRGFKGQMDPDLGDGEFSFIPASQVHTERRFRFERSNGAFSVNNRFFNPRRADAVPPLGVGAERWFFQNNSGGWWHPIHTHLEGFQIQSIEGGPLRRERRFNSDTVNLEGDFTAEVFMKFRTFTGPFAFHCHTIEHEDMRMMATHDPTPADDTLSAGAIDANPPMDGEAMIEPAQSGVVPDCPELEADERLFFDEAGDIDRLEDRGVGFRECEFNNELRGNRGRESILTATGEGRTSGRRRGRRRRR